MAPVSPLERADWLALLWLPSFLPRCSGFFRSQNVRIDSCIRSWSMSIVFFLGSSPHHPSAHMFFPSVIGGADVIEVPCSCLVWWVPSGHLCCAAARKNCECGAKSGQGLATSSGNQWVWPVEAINYHQPGGLCINLGYFGSFVSCYEDVLLRDNTGNVMGYSPVIQSWILTNGILTNNMGY